MNLFFLMDNSNQHSQSCFNINTAWVKLNSPQCSDCYEAVLVLPRSPGSASVIAVITPHLLLSLPQSFLHII